MKAPAHHQGRPDKGGAGAAIWEALDTRTKCTLLPPDCPKRDRNIAKLKAKDGRRIYETNFDIMQTSERRKKAAGPPSWSTLERSLEAWAATTKWAAASEAMYISMINITFVEVDEAGMMWFQHENVKLVGKARSWTKPSWWKDGRNRTQVELGHGEGGLQEGVATALGNWNGGRGPWCSALGVGM